MKLVYSHSLNRFFLRFSAIALFLLSLFQIHSLDALNTQPEGYVINSTQTINFVLSVNGGKGGGSWSDCQNVTAPTYPYSFFVPTKTQAEWNSFKAAAPGLGFAVTLSC